MGAVCAALAGCGTREAPDTPGPQDAAGEALFLQLCSGCHPAGRNLKNPAKSLDRMTLAANGVTGPEEIVRVLRNPGAGMPVFDRSRLSDRDAGAVARYVFERFK
jgi:mono/diheme cytochrome c family protein